MSTVLYILFSISVLYFVLLPVISLLVYGLSESESSFELIDILMQSREHLLNSLKLSIPVTMIASFFATVMAFTFWRFKFFGRKIFRLLAWLPLLNPPFVGSIAFIMLFGKRGLITHDLLGLSITPYGYYGVFAMQTIGLTTIAYLVISRGVKNMRVEYEVAARTLGSSEVKILKEISLPLLMPTILNAMLLVFLASMADFSTPLIIGGPFHTLSSNLYIQITGLYDLKTASIYGFALLIPCLLAFMIQKVFLEKKQYWDNKISQHALEYPSQNLIIKVILIMISTTMIGMYLLKIGFIIVGAFTKHWGYDYTFTLQHFKNLNNREWTPFINSVKLSFVVATSSAFLGILSAHWIEKISSKSTKYLDLLVTLPAAVPGILFGIGYLITFKYPLFGIGKFWLKSSNGVLLLGTTAIVYIICIYRYMNIGLRTGKTYILQQNPDLEKASYTLGVSGFKTFMRISYPLLMPAYEVSFLKIFSSTMTTLGAIIFLILPVNKVAVQQIFQIITSSDRGLASAMALSLSLTMLVFMGLFWLIMNLRKILKWRWL